VNVIADEIGQNYGQLLARRAGDPPLLPP